MTSTPSPDIPPITPEELLTALAALRIHLADNGPTPDATYLWGVLLAAVEGALFQNDRLDVAALNLGYLQALSAAARGDERRTSAAYTGLMRQRVDRTALSLSEVTGALLLSGAAAPALAAVSHVLGLPNRRWVDADRLAHEFDTAEKYLQEAMAGLEVLRAHFRDKGGFANL